MTTWLDSTATLHANTCMPAHDFFHFEACIQLQSFQKLWDDSQRAFQYQFRSWLLFFKSRSAYRVTFLPIMCAFGKNLDFVIEWLDFPENRCNRKSIVDLHKRIFF